MAATIDMRGSRDFRTDPATLFDYVVDPLNDPVWCPAVDGCEQIEGEGPAPGAVYRWNQIVGEGDHFPMDVTLEVVDRPNRIEWSVDNDMMGYRSEMTFEPLPNGGTRVTQHNHTTVKVAPEEMSGQLQEQAIGVMNQQFDNLEKTLA